MSKFTAMMTLDFDDTDPRKMAFVRKVIQRRTGREPEDIPTDPREMLAILVACANPGLITAGVDVSQIEVDAESVPEPAV
jgi:hypothetical protein